MPSTSYFTGQQQDLGSKVSGAASKVGDAASTVGDGVGGAVSSIADGAQQATGEVVDRAGATAQQVGWKLDSFMQANPLAMGAIAVGAGAVVGSLFPETDPERELLGDASRQVGTKLSDVVDEATTKAGGTRQRGGAAEDTPARGCRPAPAARPTAARRGGRAGRLAARPASPSRGCLRRLHLYRNPGSRLGRMHHVRSRSGARGAAAVPSSRLLVARLLQVAPVRPEVFGMPLRASPRTKRAGGQLPGEIAESPAHPYLTAR